MDGAEDNRKKFDLLRKFMKPSDCPNKNQRQQVQQDEDNDDDDDVEMELRLGLSTNGRFGVDPARSKKLRRSSSTANVVFAVGGRVEIGTSLQTPTPLARTQSLPVEKEDECRRRKEVQSIRRMEARKKRMEKLKNLRVLKDKETPTNRTGLHEFVHGKFDGGRIAGDLIESSQGSIGPLRSGSSGSSDLIQGTKPKQNAEVSPPGRQSSDEQAEPASQAGGRNTKLAGELLKRGMFDMPYVTTKETGPDGRKIEGFLYRYKKGEEVRIVCVCHGIFLTPREFVEHGGGGGGVEHPLKHIVVNHCPLS